MIARFAYRLVSTSGTLLYSHCRIRFHEVPDRRVVNGCRFSHKNRLPSSSHHFSRRSSHFHWMDNQETKDENGEYGMCRSVREDIQCQVHGNHESANGRLHFSHIHSNQNCWS
ncbi:hypothetical protein PFISCL1PPCAC_20292 [Pristionchus fissidentatus]|uniref:Uncharacterized protein n=1 Tax=Pristionchus fissidentatus TaxID=1538716 RepID=A0AAV5WEV1_9BILA|nr:hypothetical protein PFISCL1PPCAC_20292 [Pristionchus fissidentatus]